MGIRAIVVISIADSKVLFYKSFPTVEARLKELQPDLQPLPEQSQIAQSVIRELGLTGSGEFQASRDICTKQLQVPLFWIPFTVPDCGYWPAVITEKQGLLFCAVPLTRTPPENQHPALFMSPDVTIAFEVLDKLLQLVALNHSKLGESLSSVIQQWLPFGRPRGNFVGEQEAVSHRSWLRSRPQLTVQIKEELRATIGTSICSVELYGNISFQVESYVDLLDTEFHLQFTKLTVTARPDVLTHHSISALKTKNTLHYKIIDGMDTGCTVLSYRVPLSQSPVGAVYKTRANGSLLSLFFQLNLSSLGNCPLSSLEVRLSLPRDVRIVRTLSVNHQELGQFLLLRDGAQFVWNLNSILGSSRFKGDAILTLEAELNKTMEAPSIFSSSFITISLTSDQSTLSGLSVVFPGSQKYRPVTSQSLRSSIFKVWNSEAVDIY